MSLTLTLPIFFRATSKEKSLSDKTIVFKKPSFPSKIVPAPVKPFKAKNADNNPL